MYTKKLILLTALSFCLLPLCYSQAGEPDSTFGVNGFVKRSGQAFYEIYSALAIQQNNKIIVADGFRNVISRYNLNGSPDNTFGVNGEQPATGGVGGMAIQQDGKIVMVVGKILSRYTAGGLPDNTFNGNGQQTVDAVSKYASIRSVAIQSDAKIVVAGTIYSGGTNGFGTYRFNADGSPDKSFSTDGRQKISFDSGFTVMSVVIQQDGKIVVAGEKHIVRYKTNGYPDKTFGTDGKLDLDFNLSKLALQNDGKLVAVGTPDATYTYPNFEIARFNANGIPDNTFNGNGKRLVPINNVNNEAASLAFQNDGKIVVSGNIEYNGKEGIAMARYNANGSPDNSFGDNGIQKTIFANDTQFFNLIVFDNKAYASGYDYGSGGGEALLARYLLQESSTPSVRITSPDRDTNYITPGPVRLSAEAFSPAGIRSVAFYHDGILLFTDSTAPYTQLWQSVPTGSYHITAVATDNNGSKDTSATVHVTVLHNLPPFVQITSPVTGTTYYGAPVNITVRAYAEAHGVKVKTVKFFIGTTLMDTEENYPYTWTWNNVPAGIYELSAQTTDTYGRTSDFSTVRVTVIAQLCDSASKPTFSYIFNGKRIANINNGTPDAVESGSVLVCNGGKYTESGFVSNDSTNLYQVIYAEGGSAILFNGNRRSSKIITTAGFANLQRTSTLSLADPNSGGEAIVTITPFSDLNHDKKFDAGDCAGDPVTEHYYVAPCVTTCTAATKPTFSFNFNGKNVANINNGSADPGESANVTLCDGGQYSISGPFNNTFGTLYDIADANTGGTLLFNGQMDTSRIIAAGDLSTLGGSHTLTLANPASGGSVVQTITPFSDFNNNGIFDAGDCAGDPVVLTYTATHCSSKGAPGLNIAPVDNKTLINGTMDIQLSPNPVRNILTINTSGLQMFKRSVISIISASGVVVKTLQTTASTQTVRLDVSSLAGGMYIIRITSGDKIIYRQFVKM